MNRVWTYIISRELSETERKQILEEGTKFVGQWTAHEARLTASFEVFRDKIIIVKVNEQVNSASGCSIDKLTRFIKETEKNFDVGLLNRLLVAYKDNEKINVTHSTEIPHLLASGKINENTIVFNTSVSNEDELKHWELPLKSTWLNKFLQKI
jgi:hypothetical protein